jgi:hypothetical protein
MRDIRKPKRVQMRLFVAVGPPQARRILAREIRCANNRNPHTTLTDSHARQWVVVGQCRTCTTVQSVADGSLEVDYWSDIPASGPPANARSSSWPVLVSPVWVGRDSLSWVTAEETTPLCSPARSRTRLECYLRIPLTLASMPNRKQHRHAGQAHPSPSSPPRCATPEQQDG